MNPTEHETKHNTPSSKTEEPEVATSHIQILEEYTVNSNTTILIQKNTKTLEKTYVSQEPNLSREEHRFYMVVKKRLIEIVQIGLHELEHEQGEQYLEEQFRTLLKIHNLSLTEKQKEALLYFLKRDFLDYGKITPLMDDPNIEDISCDGSSEPIYIYHREYGNLKTNIIFDDEESLSSFVVKLAQKCGKHISIADPMLDATMPDGSRIQMTLSTQITTKGSTFTIRKFKDDPFTVTDLISYHTFSSEMIAYLWLAVEHGLNALIAGGTASGKTSALNAISLFIPRDSKIVSIEETREINLPHPNWIPGVARSGFGEIIGDRMVGEIDLFDLMKAALRQRPEYIIVGEIRGQEAYVLFQAMATGHTTYSTFHAEDIKSLIHRLEGKPIHIPRVMIQALDIVTIQSNIQIGEKNVRRCKDIVEVVDVDPTTKEMLTNEVFHYDQTTDTFSYSGKSYVLEKIRQQYDMSQEQLMAELQTRISILKAMQEQQITEFSDVSNLIATYSDQPELIKNRLKNNEPLITKQKKHVKQTEPIEVQQTQKKSRLKGLFTRQKNATK